MVIINVIITSSSKISKKESKKLLNLLNKPVQLVPVTTKVESKERVSKNKNNIEPNESDISENEGAKEVSGILYYITKNKLCILFHVVYLY